jgi:hypothetical protein
MHKKFLELYINFIPNFGLLKKIQQRREEYFVSNSVQAEMDARLKSEVILNGGKIKNIEVRYLGINKENRTILSCDYIKVN